MGIGKILFSYSGRINRGKFWLGYLVATLIGLVLLGTAAAMLPWDQIITIGPDGQLVLDEHGNPKLNFEGVAWHTPALLYGFGTLLSFIMGFAIMVKRCHDRGYSGWMSLIALIPFAGFIWVLIALGIMEGEKGPNRFGPDPLSQRA